MKLETFKVEKMTNRKCEREVQDTLAQISGVDQVKVDLEKERTSVLFNPGQVQLDKLKDEVRAAGYEVK